MSTSLVSLLIISIIFSIFIQDGNSTFGNEKLSPTTTTVLRRHTPKELVFAEEFFHLDTNVWYHEISPPGHKNGEFQSYSDSPENSYVRDGVLYIKPTYRLDIDKYGSRKNRSINSSQRGKNPKISNSLLTPADQIFNPIVSARLNTRRAFAFQYGELEVRAKVPEGDWIWPAIWLLPQQYRYGEWPLSGEIDVMECRSNLQLKTSKGEDIGVNQYGSTVHFGLDRASDMWRLAHYPNRDDAGFHSRFHTYGLIWTPERFQFTLDGEIVGTLNVPQGGFWELGGFNGSKIWSEERMSPFDQPFNIVLNVAIGGTFGFFPDNTGPKKKPWVNSSPTAQLDFWEARDQWIPTWRGEDSAMQVDYVRVWAL